MSTSFDLSPLPPAAEPPRLRVVPDPAPPCELAEAVERLRPRLLRYVTRRLGDRHEAEEVVQETLLRAHQHAATLRTEDELAAWTTVVAGRLAVDRLRVRGRSTCVAEVPEGRRRSRDTAEVVVARDEARTALDALDAMSPRQAAVLWAREVEGLDYAAIGERFAMTEPAVRSILTRARKALRKEYAARGGTLPAGGIAVLAPWVDGLTWLARLRRGATRALTGPAVVGSLGLAVLGGALTVPSLLDPPRVPSTAVERVGAPRSTDVGSGASTPAAVAPPPAVDVTAVLPLPTPALPAGATYRPGLLHGTGLNDACTSRSAPVGAGGRGCAPGPRGARVQLQPPVPVPVPVPVRGGGEVGLELPHRYCATLRGTGVPAPDSPLVREDCLAGPQ